MHSHPPPGDINSDFTPISLPLSVAELFPSRPPSYTTSPATSLRSSPVRTVPAPQGPRLISTNATTTAVTSLSAESSRPLPHVIDADDAAAPALRAEPSALPTPVTILASQPQTQSATSAVAIAPPRPPRATIRALPRPPSTGPIPGASSNPGSRHTKYNVYPLGEPIVRMASSAPSSAAGPQLQAPIVLHAATPVVMKPLPATPSTAAATTADTPDTPHLVTPHISFHPTSHPPSTQYHPAHIHFAEVDDQPARFRSEGYMVTSPEPIYGFKRNTTWSKLKRGRLCSGLFTMLNSNFMMRKRLTFTWKWAARERDGQFDIDEEIVYARWDWRSRSRQPQVISDPDRPLRLRG